MAAPFHGVPRTENELSHTPALVNGAVHDLSQNSDRDRHQSPRLRSRSSKAALGMRILFSAQAQSRERGGRRTGRKRKADAKGKEPSPEVPLVSGVCPGSASVAGVMASRLLRGAGALVAQALRARGSNAVAAVRCMASGGGVPTDDDQATGLEREVMMAARKGLVRRKLLSVSSLELLALDGTRAFFSGSI